MVKNLSENINFVKEFEELKLKQRLLVESLGRKNKSELNQYLVDMNSKLDFLVKIFQESTNHEESEEEVSEKDELNSNISSILDKVKSIESNLDSKFSLIEDKLSSFDKKLNSTSLDNLVKTKNSPPIPNFKVGDNVSDDSNLEKSKKKDSYVPSNLELAENIKKEKKTWF